MKSGLAILFCAAAIASASPSWGQNTGASPIETLHQALHLSPQQEPAWKAYRAQSAAPSQAQARRQAASQMFQSLNAPQRMDLVEAELKQELVDLQKQSAVLKSFYATLSPDQRATFDAQTLPPANPPQQRQ